MSGDHLLPEELDKLQTTLVEHLEQSGCMPLDVAHGYLTAVAAHPEQVPVEQARAVVLGELAPEAAIDGLLEKFQAQLLRDLESGMYGPLIMQMPRDDGSLLPLPYGWCEGYQHGLVSLGEQVQDQLMADQEVAGHLAPVFAFLMYDEQQMFDPPDEQGHRDAVAELGEAAVFVYRWWLQRSGGLQ